MANDPKLKVSVEADTSRFSKGMKQAKSDLTDFSKVSSSAMSSLGNAVGVPVDKLNQMSGALRGLGAKMTEAGSAGTKAFGKLLTSISGVGTAVAGLGIGAAVIAFKSLNAEAENFKKTVAGANIELMTGAYVSTYQQALHDMNSATGKSVAEFEAKLKEKWGVFSANFKQDIVSTITGEGALGGGWGRALIGPLAGLIGSGDRRADRQDAEAKAQRAAELQGEIYQLQLKRVDVSRSLNKLDGEILRLEEDYRDKTKSAEERARALAEAKELIHVKAATEYEIESSIAEKMQEIVDLANSTPEEIAAAAQQWIKADNILNDEQRRMNSLVRQQNSIATQAEKEADARAKSAVAVKGLQTALDRVKMMDFSGLAVSNPLQAPQVTLAPSRSSNIAGLAGGPSGNAFYEEFKNLNKLFYKQYPDGLKIGVAFDVSKGMVDLSKDVETALGGLAESTGEVVGQLIGDLVTGGDAWGNFANAAVTAFGDMAISVGKMAIATGTATLGIKAALESLNGYVAIAAGAALVALGTAVKTGLSNVASGNYSASTNVASGSMASSFGSDYMTRVTEVKVTGKLVANGSQLVAVLDNESNRKQHTT